VGQGAGEEMKETPVLMKGEMVRAILDGRKTQTRRVIKPQPEDVGAVNMIKLPDQLGDQVHYYFQSNSGKIGLFKPPFIKCPFGHKGDLLLVAASGTGSEYPWKWAATEQIGWPVSGRAGGRREYTAISARSIWV
jgi:hypothetical protein